MTTAQIIQFPVNRASTDKQPAQRATGPAQVVIFPGVRQERLEPKRARPQLAARTKPKRPILAD